MRNPKLFLVAGFLSFALLGGVEVATSQARPAAAATFTGNGGGSLGAAATPQGNVGGVFTSDPTGARPGTGISIGRGSSYAPQFGSSTGTGSSSPVTRPPVPTPDHCGCQSSFTMPTAPTNVPAMPNLSSFGHAW